jgi:hypothetical protein
LRRNRLETAGDLLEFRQIGRHVRGAGAAGQHVIAALVAGQEHDIDARRNAGLLVLPFADDLIAGEARDGHRLLALDLLAAEPGEGAEEILRGRADIGDLGLVDGRGDDENRIGGGGLRPRLRHLAGQAVGLGAAENADGFLERPEIAEPEQLLALGPLRFDGRRGKGALDLLRRDSLAVHRLLRDVRGDHHRHFLLAHDQDVLAVIAGQRLLLADDIDIVARASGKLGGARVDDALLRQRIGPVAELFDLLIGDGRHLNDQEGGAGLVVDEAGETVGRLEPLGDVEGGAAVGSLTDVRSGALSHAKKSHCKERRAVEP